MTQQPGQGPGQFGPQGPRGPQGPNPPQGPQGPYPYGSTPTTPPQYGPPANTPPPQYGAPQPPYTPPQFGPPQQTYGGPPSGTGQSGYASQPQFPQQPYGAPQGQPQNPYGSTPTPPRASAYGQAPGAWSPTAGLPPAPPKKSKTGLMVAVIALAVVLVGGAGLWLALRPKTTIATGTITSVNPTTSATKASTSGATKATTAATKATTTSKTSSGDATCSGSTIVSDAYSATVPKGWECSGQSGTLMITDAKFDTLMVMTIPSSTDAAKVCSSLSSAGTLTELPDTQWGGKTAKTADIASGSTKMHVRCVSAGGSVYYLMAIPITGKYADIVAGTDALTSGWTWK